jgi:hypothetical protein
MRGLFSIGSVDYQHKGETIRSIVGSPLADKYIVNSNKIPIEIGFIPEGFQFRPDLIAETFYDSPASWWNVMLQSNIPDYKDLKVYTRIILPRRV